MEELLAYATDVLAGWLDGWMEPSAAGGPQRRAVVTAFNDPPGVLDVRIEGAPWTGERDRRFRFTLAVEPLED